MKAAHIAGFTLLEAQLAMVIMAFIMVIGYGSLHMFGRHWHAAQYAGRNFETRYLISQFLRRQLEQSVPLLLGGDGELRLFFEGSADRLQFVGRLPHHRGEGGLHIVRILHRDGSLVFSYTPLIGGTYPPDYATENATILLTDVREVEISYFGHAGGEAPPGWHSSWNEALRLPILIRLRIREGDGEPPRDLIAAHPARVHMDRPELRLISGHARP